VFGCGVAVSVRDELALATILVRNGKSAALASCLREKLNVELPLGAPRAAAGDITLICMGPSTWIAAYENAHGISAMTLIEATRGLAAVVDQSDGYAVLQLSGPKVRSLLSNLAPIDVHARAFQVGDVAATAIAHMGATLWRLENSDDGSPVFQIAVPRSVAASFLEAVSYSVKSLVPESPLSSNARHL
jgi:sarcosine oxidase subunit gamma